MAMIAAEASGIPWSFTAHRWDIAEDNLLSRKLRTASFVRAISERGAAALHSVVPNARVHVIHVGVEVAEEPSRSATDGAPLKVVVAANLVEVKGHVYLLRAVAALKHDGVTVQLDVIGDGHLRESLERTATTLGVRDLVSFHGAVSHEELLHRLRGHTWDVCVLPSIVTSTGEHEGIPVSLLEAMSASVPVVATSTGSIPELLGDGAGVLVPPNDPDALAAALADLARDARWREALGRAGRDRVRHEFDVRSTTERLLVEIARFARGRG
jgi:glycosyltransferase involved in cell wall biosynthesis